MALPRRCSARTASVKTLLVGLTHECDFTCYLRVDGQVSPTRATIDKMPDKKDAEALEVMRPNQLKQVFGGVIKADNVDIDKARARHLKRKRRKSQPDSESS